MNRFKVAGSVIFVALLAADAVPQEKKSNGNTCQSDGECSSGFCTDGVCAANRCNGPCEAANLSGQWGSCVAIPNLQDPDNECPGLDSTCNGARSCTAYVTGVSLNSRSINAGSEAVGTVQLSRPASFPLTITLSSSATDAVTIDGSITIAVGQSSGTFRVVGKPVTSQIPTTISAISRFNIIKTASLTVMPPVTFGSISVSSSRILKGQTVTATISLTGPVAVDTLVTISTTTPHLVSLPATVTIPAGAKGQTFRVVTTTEIQSNQTANVTAIALGTTRSARIEVLAQ